MGRKFLKRGFTLIETVVTIGIIASLTAAVVPQVVKQFDSADPTRLQTDLKNLQTAVETFNVNVKAVPGDMEDLANLISATTDSALTSSTSPLFLSPSQTGLWNGPYVDFAIIENGTTEASRPTGYGAKILDGFVCYNSVTNAHGTTIGVAATNDPNCASTTDQKFLAIQITGLAAAVTDANFIALNKLFDDDAAESAASTRGTAGRVRFGTVGTNNVVYFLTIPLS